MLTMALNYETRSVITIDGYVEKIEVQWNQTFIISELSSSVPFDFHY